MTLGAVAALWHRRGGRWMKMESAGRQQLRLSAAAYPMRSFTGAEKEPVVPVLVALPFRFCFHRFQ